MALPTFRISIARLGGARLGAVRLGGARRGSVRLSAVLLGAALLSPRTTHASESDYRGAATFRAYGGCAAVGRIGDASGDDVISAEDGEQLARYAAGLELAGGEDPAARGDVDGNAVVNIIDAQLVARYAAGFDILGPGSDRINAGVFTAPVVTSVVLLPANAPALAPGNSVQLTAIAQDGGTDVSECTDISWSASDESVVTVSATGRVTAIGSGTATITAAWTANPSVRATIDVTVAAAPASEILFSESFENANLGSRGWYDNTTAVLSSSEKFAGNSSAQFRFPAGAKTPTSGNSMRHKFAPTNSVYISYYVKYSPNWVGSGHSYHPHEFYLMTTMDANDYVGPSNSWLTAYLEHNYQNGLRPLLGLQDNKAINTSMGTPSRTLDLSGVTENRSVSGCNGVVETDMTIDCFAVPGETPPWYNAKTVRGPVAMTSAPGENYKGNWNFVEAYFQLNTISDGIGRADGILQYWLNGKLIINRTDVLFRTGARPAIQFNKLLIAPYIGDGSPVDQSMYIDDLVVKTSR